MDDPKNILDGPVDDVKTRIAGLSHDDLLKVRDAENAGEKRADVLLVIEAATDAADAARAGGVVQMTAPAEAAAPVAATRQTIAADLDASGPANIAPATTFSTSGAPVQIVPGVDPGHPAIDDNPRSGTTVNQNKIDMNDPTITGAEAVKRNLEAQAKG